MAMWRCRRLWNHCSSQQIVNSFNNILSNKINPYCQIKYTKHLELSKKYRKLLSEMKSIDPKNVYIFDTLPILCNIDLDICTSSYSGKRLYKYSDHINEYAAELIGKKLDKFLKEIEDK